MTKKKNVVTKPITSVSRINTIKCIISGMVTIGLETANYDKNGRFIGEGESPAELLTIKQFKEKYGENMKIGRNVFKDQ